MSEAVVQSTGDKADCNSNAIAVSDVVLSSAVLREQEKLEAAAEKNFTKIEQEAQKKLEAAKEGESDKAVWEQLEMLLQATGVFKDLIRKRMDEQRQIEQRKAKIKRKPKQTQADKRSQQPTRKSARRPSVKRKEMEEAADDDEHEQPSKPKRARSSKASKDAAEEDEAAVKTEGKYNTNNDKENNEEVTEKMKEREAEAKDDTIPWLFGDESDNLTLRDYQIDGFKWMKSLFMNGINGILADEMGLGKTIQAIAMCCFLYERDFTRDNPILIVAPLSTLANWEKEFKKFAPQVPTVRYHGHLKSRRQLLNQITRPTFTINGLQGKRFPVVISTYEVVLIDKGPLAKVPFAYFILDEGHRIKNFKCKLHAALKELNLKTRILMTGTPLQNNLTELWSLLNFLMPDVFNSADWFLDFFDFSDLTTETVSSSGAVGRTVAREDIKNVRERGERLIEKDKQKNMVQKIHDILGTFMLRREKKDVELTLPPKKEVLIYGPLTLKQQKMYKDALDYQLGPLKNIGNSDDPKNLIVKEKRKSKAVYRMSDILKIEEGDDSDLLVGNKEVEQVESQEEENTPTAAIKNGGVAYCWSSVRSMMITLRKITMHPHLLEFNVDEHGHYIPDETTVTDSGKMLVLDCLLKELFLRKHKVIIFSQWVKMLNILHDFCIWRGYNITTLDGRDALDEREEAMEKFNKDPTVFAMLVSTRAGGLGINLTSADTVVIYDSDWNPQMDLQAQDRCHRIGQTRPVVVYRICAIGTIDDRLVQTAQNKRRLEKIIIDSERRKGNKRELSAAKKSLHENLLELLSSVDYSDKLDAIAHGGSAISDEALEKILDRNQMMKAWKLGKEEKKIKETGQLLQREKEFMVLE